MAVEVQVLVGAIVIFLLRVLGMSVSTVRMLTMIQGRKMLSAALGFIESLVFAITLGGVVTQLDNLWNLGAYCLGFAAGIHVGLMIEARFITNFVTVNVVSPHAAHKIADAVREAGFGATETWGQGADGLVGAVRIVCQRREVQRVISCVNEVDADAFITLDETRSVRHGYVRLGRA